MAACTICGRERELRDAIIEGSIQKVCGVCSKFGKIIEVKPQIIERKIIQLKVEEENEMIVPDYFEKVKKAREELDLKQEELAREINEKESIIHSIETGNLVPTIALAKKLENALNIRIIDYYTLERTKPSLNLKNSSLTVGDLLKLKKD